MGGCGGAGSEYWCRVGMVESGGWVAIVEGRYLQWRAGRVHGGWMDVVEGGYGGGKVKGGYLQGELVNG